MGVFVLPPTADAGPDQTVPEWTIVTLDGLKSTDPLDGVLAHLWEQLDGPPVDLVDPTSACPTFISPQLGSGAASLSFRLTVTNSFGSKSTDICLVNVTLADTPPNAAAGPDQTAAAGAVLELERLSSAPAGVQSFLSETDPGAPVSLSDPTSAKPSFTVINAGPYDNPLVFRFTVRDANGLRSRANQQVLVK